MSRSLSLAVAALVLTAVPLGAATPRVSYDVARDREQAVRTRLDTASPTKAAIDEARRVVQSYDAPRRTVSSQRLYATTPSARPPRCPRTLWG